MCMMFAGEEALREEKSRTLWSLIVNFYIPLRDKNHRKRGKALYSYRKEFLTTYLIRDPTRVQLSTQANIIGDYNDAKT